MRNTRPLVSSQRDLDDVKHPHRDAEACPFGSVVSSSHSNVQEKVHLQDKMKMIWGLSTYMESKLMSGPLISYSYAFLPDLINLSAAGFVITPSIKVLPAVQKCCITHTIS